MRSSFLDDVHVKFPDYYKNASSRISDYIVAGDKAHTGGVNGKRDYANNLPRINNKNKTGTTLGGTVQEHGHSESNSPSEKADAQSRRDKCGVLFDKNHLSQDHPKSEWYREFTAALERHGSSPGAWKDMASELKCTERNVKVYAYSYFKALVMDRDEKISNDMLDKNGCQTWGDSATGDKWSFQELVLLDSLLVKFFTDLTCLDDVEGDGDDQECPCLLKQTSVWEKIASQLPGKTARDCKKEGTNRLRKVCEEQQKANKGIGAAVDSGFS
jgi:hypothetical protein